MLLGNVGQKPNPWYNIMDFSWIYIENEFASHKLSGFVTILAEWIMLYTCLIIIVGGRQKNVPVL